MAFRLLADATVVAHLAFVLFVVAGGLLVLRWPRVAWAHVPAVAWGAWVEFAGWICPLTPLENWLRARGGQTAYTASFIDQYVRADAVSTRIVARSSVAAGRPSAGDQRLRVLYRPAPSR